MDNFIFYNPTRLIFGKGMIAQLSQQIPANNENHDHFRRWQCKNKWSL